MLRDVTESDSLVSASANCLPSLVRMSNGCSKERKGIKVANRVSRAARSCLLSK